MITTRITLDTKAVTAQLTDLQQKQLPFARSLAVNNLGLAFQRAERERLASIFTLRRKDFIEKQGVKRISPADTKQNPSVTYGMDRKADFLQKFEHDTAKLPTKGAGHNIAIPALARRNKSDIVTTPNRPKALLARLGHKKGAGRVFIVENAKGRLGPGIYQTTGRQGKGALKALFTLKPRVSIDPELAFEATARKVATERWSQIFDEALAFALKTAR